MKVVNGLGDVSIGANGSVVTIGAYDGVHRGHQAVLGEVARLASAGAHVPVLVTFDRHPASIVRPATAPRLLTDLDQKLELIAATGSIELALVLTFDTERAAEEPEHFVSSVLVGSLGARIVVVGEDFHFGRGRRGDVTLLRRLGAEMGFTVVGLGLVPGGITGVPVSSTAVRAALAAGEVVAAAELLGRQHEVRGVVEGGDRRGRELGYPTANLAVPREILLPALGIYAGTYERPGNQVHPAAISLGVRPTFGESGPAVLEAHLLDFDGDLYGEAGRVRFVERLRDEARFDSIDDLLAAMAGDVAATRSLVAI